MAQNQMSRTARAKRKSAWATSLFYFLLTLTIFVYVLRGVALLSMMPGGILWAMILLTIASGVLAILLSTR
jgi:uncharacterized membrane protein YhaH (DUF805 family)